MRYSQINVPIPDVLYNEMNTFISEEKIKLSHLVTQAIVNQLKRLKNERYIRKVNTAFNDRDIFNEQHKMAELVAENINTKDLEW